MIAGDYARDGFVVVPDFLPPGACAALIERAEQIAGEQAPSGPRSVFSTAEQARRSDEWFLESGDQVRSFFETEALAEDGSLAVEPGRAINKIGHALHDLDPVFAAVSYDPRMLAIATAVGMQEPLAVQSMAIFKQPGIGGEVGCHQDATFLYTEPLTVTGFWIALEDATLDNGCLWALPGGHREPLRKRFARKAGGGTEFQLLDATPLPGQAQMVPLPVAAGTLVVLHGLLPHYSGANRSPRRRLAYSLHCIEAAALYPAWNWLRRGPALPLRRLADGPPGL
ncbi:MAG: phytanoyl-CoA dioxygenase family protein [Nannocystis sp.]|nr:phytanoyl-CoA dioxygenase family protein [Nannocystis sp.]MBA3547922.1 phytanoyl-CoA dioxygenase family protein [Nannocystis sp.]